MAMTEAGSTLLHMGQNFISSPTEFIGYGFSETRKAASQAMPRLPKLTPPLQRPLPDETVRDGDVSGSRLRDSFESSQPRESRLPKQQAYNLIGPSQYNVYGGRFELVG